MKRRIDWFLRFVGSVVVGGSLIIAVVLFLTQILPSLQGPTPEQLTATQHAAKSTATQHAISRATVNAGNTATAAVQKTASFEHGLTATSAAATRQAVAQKTAEALLIETAVQEILATSASKTQSYVATQKMYAELTATSVSVTAQAIRELTATSTPTATHTQTSTPTPTSSSTPTPTSTPTNTLTPTRTPQPTADPNAGTYHASRSGSVNVRSCPRTSCTIVDQYQFGESVQVVEIVTGDAVGGDSSWAKTKDGDYIHTSLLRRGAFSPTRTPRPTVVRGESYTRMSRQNWYVARTGNLRDGPGTTFDRAGGINYRKRVSVIGWKNGEVVSGSARWYVIEHGDGIAWAHSSLLSDVDPASLAPTTVPTQKPQPVQQPTVPQPQQDTHPFPGWRTDYNQCSRYENSLYIRWADLIDRGGSFGELARASAAWEEVANHCIDLLWP